MTITRSELLFIAALLALGLSIYEIYMRYGTICEDGVTYETKELEYGGKQVDKTWAMEKVRSYQAEHASDETIYYTTGFTMSKKVFEEIFKDCRINSVTFDLIVDEGKLALLASGEHNDSTGISFDEKAESRIFVSQTLCPNDCAKW